MSYHDHPSCLSLRHGPGFGAVLLIVCLFEFASWSVAEEPPIEVSRGVLIRFEGTITPMLQQYLYRKLETAESDGADLVIVEIESPGGYLEESLEIAERLRDLPWAHTVAYVPQRADVREPRPGRALSGAAIVALGCDEIVMGPNASMGDAGPIFMGEDFLFRHAPEKVRTDLALQIRDLAEAHGRPPALAEAMVDTAVVVWQVTNTETGEVTYMADHDIESDPNPDRWEKGPPVDESREGQFLEVKGDRAVVLGLAEANVAGRDELAARYQLETLTILEPTGVDTAVYILNRPWVTGLLFIVGLIALYIEFSAPGIGVGGLTAVLCFAIFFWSRFLGGTAGWLEVVLFVSGIMFLGVELFVLPGFGVAGVSGILLLLASVIMASQGFVIPETPRQLTIMTQTLLMVMLSALVCTLAVAYLSPRMGTLPVFKRLVLKPPDPAAQAQAAAGDEDKVAGIHAELKVGDRGIAQSALRPAGKAQFGNRYADVVTDGEFINKLSHIEVMQVIGNRIIVRQVTEKR